jgi:hypothetical protein
MIPRRIGFHLKYVASTLYTVFREILGFFLVFLSNWPSLYIPPQLAISAPAFNGQLSYVVTDFFWAWLWDEDLLE